MMEKQDITPTQHFYFEVKQETIEIKQEVCDGYETDEQNENIFGENEETSMEVSEFCQVKTEIESDAVDNGLILNDENSKERTYSEDDYEKEIPAYKNNFEFCEKFPKKQHSTTPRPHKCNICNKRFTQKSILTVHYMRHSGLRPFKCDVCKKCFTQSNDLNRHYRIHTGSKPFECDICRKCFSQRSGLNAHYRLHTGSRPYVCDFCSRTFIRSSQLTVHIRTHTGARPYECDICKKTFSRKEILTRHMLIHKDKEIGIKK